MAMRFFGMKDLHEIDIMTRRDFRLRLKAYELERVDDEYRIALLAWQIREIEAKKKNGKKYRYVYDTFKRFFDYEKHVNRIMGTKGHEDREKTPAERYLEYMRMKQCQDTT